MKLAKQIQVIMCDDVRNETGGKFSLMGIYPHNIVFQKLPTTLPKLCFCIIMQDVKTEFRESTIRLTYPEVAPIVLSSKLHEESQLGQHIALFAVYTPFIVKAPGPAKLKLKTDKDKGARIIHTFDIIQAPQ